jgi:hypothetical protein
VFVGWHKTAKWGFSTPFPHSGDLELGAFPIFQTVSEEVFYEVRTQSEQMLRREGDRRFSIERRRSRCLLHGR